MLASEQPHQYPSSCQVRGKETLRRLKGCPAVRSTGSRLSFEQADWRDSSAVEQLLVGADALVHTAGPFGAEPAVLKAAIRARVPVYVDLSDPIEYIQAGLDLSAEAEAAGTCALLCAGAFPGLSNVLATECAARLGERVRDLHFSYFTAGLGGSGAVNLYITNVGFGTPVPVFRNGVFTQSMEAGSNTRCVRFFLDPSDASATLVGERPVWSWPFPEGATVGAALGIAGDSSVGMGTAPDVWNGVMGALVAAVPRGWWLSPAFSQGMATFSRPLVALTDRFVGETHAMRIDATSVGGRRVSAVQAHRSFREVVGQSAAEFTLAMLGDRVQRVKSSPRDAVAGDGGGGGGGGGVVGLASTGGSGSVGVVTGGADGWGSAFPPAGVWTPEKLFAEQHVRSKLLDRMLAVDGTLNWGFTADAVPDKPAAAQRTRDSAPSA